MENGGSDCLGALRDRLAPLAKKMAAATESLAAKLSSVAGSETLPADIAALRKATLLFGENLESALFSEAEGRSAATAHESLRSARHDSRNKLNHILGPLQFIAADAASKPAADAIADLHDLCQQCLSTLDSAFTYDAEAASETPTRKAPETGLILVADDDAENRSILARLLEPQGHEVAFAEDGEEALEKIRACDFDAVLLDIRMPKIDGFGVLEALRESGHLRHTPVIVVTGLQEEKDAVRCIEIGAEDFLSRPIRPAFLTARLNASLEKKRLREKVFEQHFTPDLAREFARNPDPMKMKGRSAEVSVLFCDIRRFSSVSERLGPEQTIDWLGGVMGEFSASVLDHGGVLVDYTGDELLAMWGAPKEQPDHAEQACRAALDMIAKLPELNEKWEPLIEAETAVGIGVNTGVALVGNIGTYKKFKYGPLGTTVNLGSRVQGATKFLRTTFLATGNTVGHLCDDFCCRRLCSVRVQNIREPVELYEISLAGQEDWHELRSQYEEALIHFENEKFYRASALLGDLLVRFPGDGPSLQLMARVVEAMLKAGEPFDPVWELPGK